MTDVRPADVRAELRDTARRLGPDVAIERLHRAAGADTLLFGRTGHALAPRELAERARHVCYGGAVRPRDRGREVELDVAPLSDLDVVALRMRAPEPGVAEPSSRWSIAVLWLRLGLAGRLLDRCLVYLGERSVADGPLLRQQLVKGTLADVVIAQLDLETMLASIGPRADPETLADLHRQVTGADRELLRLLGAYGFTVDSPAAAAYVSELLADAYAPAVEQEALT